MHLRNISRRLTFLCLALAFAAAEPASAQRPIVSSPPQPANGAGPAATAGEPGDSAALAEEVRKLKAQVAELQSQNYAILGHMTFGPPTVSTEDYAEARRGFRTKLIRQGPSPQVQPRPKPPAGVSEIEYRSGDLPLMAWINRPEKPRGKAPAVLYLHGGFAFGAGDWEQTKPYRDAGFVVMAPMLRGENGLPGAFSYFYDEVDDVLAAAERLSKEPYVDSQRLFLAGHSIGGTMTMLAALASDRFRAAAAIDGAPYWGPLIEAKDLPFDKSDPREIQLRSALVYAGGFKCPLRIYHQRRDQSPLVEYFALISRRAVLLAQGRGLDVEDVEIDGNHMTLVPASVRQSIAFFERVSGRETAPWGGKVAELPPTLALDLGDGLKLDVVRIEPGKFQMGSPPKETGRQDDERQHEAVIARPFGLGRHLVTQAQYRQVMGMNPSLFSARGRNKERVSGIDTDAFPVENVTWDDATDFCRIASLLPAVRDKGWMVDLPTEAEWEYACRAGTTTAFHTGDTLSVQQANFSVGRPTPVGSYEPNAWGLYDMHGNVLEWCRDAYAADYEPKDLPGDADRVARGGLFNFSAADCRAARRYHFPRWARRGETYGFFPIGFRVVVRARPQAAERQDGARAR